MRNGKKDGIWTVSYTHLDVYKRQVLNSWLSDLVADCNEDEVKIITDTVTALKASLHRNRSEDK